MADKKGKGGAKTAPGKKAEPELTPTEKAELRAEDKAKEDNNDAGYDDGVIREHGEPRVVRHAIDRSREHETTEQAAHGHAHKPNIREYLVIFVVLAVLTVIEVGLAKVPGISRKLLGLGLVGLALTKAAIVGLYYMHLKHETRVLKLTVAIPMAAPTIYALVLISEAAWRLTR